MTIAVTIAAVLILAVVTVLVSRAGASRRQEDLNEHEGAPATGHARQEERDRPAQPKSEAPAGPDAEAMGVSDAGATSVDPTGEQRG